MSLRLKIGLQEIILGVLSLACLFLALKTSGDPILGIFRGTWIEPLLQQFPLGNAIIFNLSLGFLVSVIFYVLVVRLPDRQRKNLIKKNMIDQYVSFKEATIFILLSAARINAAPELVEKLVNQKEFQKYFKEPVGRHGERWHDVLNGLDELHLKDLLVEMEILRDEISYVLNNENIKDPDVFSFFKRLSQAVYKLKNTTLDSDDVEQLSRFLWELFAGWSFISGQRENDIVAVMIEKI